MSAGTERAVPPAGARISAADHARPTSYRGSCTSRTSSAPQLPRLPSGSAHARSCAQPEQATRFINKRTEGFWNIAPASTGGGAYRAVNKPPAAWVRGSCSSARRRHRIQTSVIPEQCHRRRLSAPERCQGHVVVPAQLLRCGQPQASAKRHKVAVLPLLPAQLAVMLWPIPMQTQVRPKI